MLANMPASQRHLRCKSTLARVCLLALASGLPCAATVINIDLVGHPNGGNSYYDTYQGQGEYVTNDAHYWNGYTLFYSGGNTGDPSPMTNLLASDGTITTVGFDLGQENTASLAGDNPTYQDLLDDYAYSFQGGIIPLTISGLIPGNVYDLYFYGTAGSGSDQGSIFHVNNGSPADMRTEGGDPGNDYSFVAGDLVTNPYVDDSNYVVFTSVVANGSGEITGDTTRNGLTSWGAFNGLQIVDASDNVPEPSTWGLALAGLLGLSAAARRRSRLFSRKREAERAC
jgi:PEP-CTERM motif